jgi:hypothetical protein
LLQVARGHGASSALQAAELPVPVGRGWGQTARPKTPIPPTRALAHGERGQSQAARLGAGMGAKNAVFGLRPPFLALLTAANRLGSPLATRPCGCWQLHLFGQMGPTKLLEVQTKKLPLRKCHKRATKTPWRPANSTGKRRRPNKGGALSPVF